MCRPFSIAQYGTILHGQKQDTNWTPDCLIQLGVSAAIFVGGDCAPPSRCPSPLLTLSIPERFLLTYWFSSALFVRRFRRKCGDGFFETRIAPKGVPERV